MRLLIVILFVHSYSLLSQTFSLDFEDKNLNNWQELHNNHWAVDSTAPISGMGSLHHAFDDSISNYDCIVYPHEQLLLDSAQTTWDFKVMYGYTPSGSNNWAFCLTSTNGVEQMNPSGNVNAYFIGVNFTGTDDIVKFWKKEGTSNTAILSTTFNWQDNVAANEVVSFHTIRSKDGVWTFYLKKEGDLDWTELGSCEENSLTKSKYLGLYYKYSSTKDQLLWLDDVKVEGFFYTDSEAPAINNVSVINKNTLEIEFSEEIDTISPPTFKLNGSSQPSSSKWNGTSLVQLTFDNTFDLNNSIELSNLADLNGNIAENTILSFQFYLPQIYDVVFTEIMADPSDSVGLPEEEYLEIYNRTSYSINIKDWRLFVGDKSYTLPNRLIQPHQYSVLTSSSGNWLQFTNSVIEMGSFPSLTNAGNLIQLKDGDKNTIHAVQYSDDWYETDFKKDGGWSLEMVDVNEPCIEKDNWKESRNNLGGTPGAINSNASEIISNIEVEIEKVSVDGSNVLSLQFSTSMDSSSVVNTQNYKYSSELNLNYIESIPPFYNQVNLYFSNDFKERAIYEIQPLSNILSCFGTSITENTFGFGLPQTPVENDLVINEVLFASNDLAPEFIEVMNLSGNVLELKGCWVGLMNDESGALEKETLLTNESLLVLPNELYVFTENKALLTESFPSCDKKHVFEIESWPTLSNNGGELVIANSNMETIDIAVYNPDFHHPLLIEQSGVSLEKINPSLSGLLASSWHSAASDVGYATPTLANSQFSNNTNTADKRFTISPKELSPNNDGFNDYLQIAYSFNNQGVSLSATVYSQAGAFIKKVADNEICGTSGVFTWNGLSIDGDQLPMGFYIILIEAINVDGEIYKKKETILMLPEKK